METVTKITMLQWLAVVERAIAANKEHLTQLDAEIGDADHGTNMDRGFQAVGAKLVVATTTNISSVLTNAGMVLVSTVGGSSGPLYGTFFLRMGAAAGHKAELSGEELAAVLEAGVKGVVDRGKAAPGEKTMLDALLPGLAALREALAAGAPLAQAARRAADAARAGAEATMPMQARKGRASYLGARSVGHKDPGAASAALILEALAEILATGGA